MPLYVLYWFYFSFSQERIFKTCSNQIKTVKNTKLINRSKKNANGFTCFRGKIIKRWNIIQRDSSGQVKTYFSSHHSFSLRTCSSSAGVKSFLMLNVFRISSGVLPLIMFATVLQVTSNKPLMSR